MDIKMISIVLVLAMIVGIGAMLSMQGGTQGSINATKASTTAPSSSGQNTSKTLFADTQYAPYSYQIYPGPLSQQAQSALSGFNMTTTMLQGGSANVTLSLAGTNQSKSMILGQNYKLYIIETTFGDDGFHFDSSLGDDGFVIVDPNGYVA